MATTLRQAFGISSSHSRMAENVYTGITYLWCLIAIVTIVCSVTLLYIEDREERATLFKTLIGLNWGIMLPTVLLSTIKMMLERNMPLFHYIGMLMTLISLILTNPGTYLYIAYMLEGNSTYSTVQKGLIIGSSILPVVTLPYYIIMGIWWYSTNFSSPD